MKKLFVAAAAIAAVWFVGASPSRAQLIPDCDVVVSADITTSETWTADNQYCLDQQIYVTNGATLTIMPGTIVRGDPESSPGAKDPGALIITRGAKLKAMGTLLAPITFTDLDDDNIGSSLGTPPYDNLRDARSLVANWGGVIVLGYGYVADNTPTPDPTRERQIEGLDPVGGKGLYGNCAAFLPGPYGRNCDDGDSGTINYTSLRYGGFVIGGNNEINGFSFGGVGRNTDIEYIEVFQNKDDGIEWFGGAANVKHAIVANVGDDGFDYDEGARFKLQFGFVLQGLPGTDKSDKGGEWDGALGTDTSQPQGIGTFYNVTMVGHGQKPTYTGKQTNTAMHIRDGAGARVFNSAFLDFGGASMLLEGTGTSCSGAGSVGGNYDVDYTPDGVYFVEPAQTGDKEVQFANDTWWCMGSESLPQHIPGGTCSVAGTDCCSNADCPVGQTCVDEGPTWGGDTGKIHRGRSKVDVFSNLSRNNFYETCASALPIRALVRDTVLPGDPTLPDPVLSIDPRPASGSSLLGTTRVPPSDGFYQPAAYRGAFEAKRNWADGWSTLSRLGYFPPKPQITKSADITASETWSSDNEYILDQQIYVTNGATLTIEPGTVIRGETESSPGAKDPGAIIISRGSKIQALGTEDYPIVMTDLSDDNLGGFPGTSPYDNAADARSLVANWGGLILLGYGYVADNTPAPDPTRERQIEGLDPVGGKGLYGNCAAFLPGPYGRNCDDGDSGTIHYTSLRYGGFIIGGNNEINGISLGAVGRNTNIDYVEIFQNKDDGIEWFGGAANVRHAIVANVGDDGFDYDEGARFNLQYGFVMQGLAGNDKSDKGGEWDGALGTDTSLPQGIGTLYNVTMVGHGQKSTYTGKRTNTAMHIRDGAGARVYNSAFLDFGGGSMLLEGTGTACNGAGSVGGNYDVPYVVDGVYQIGPAGGNEVDFTNNTWWCMGSESLPQHIPGATCSVSGADCCSNADCPAGQTCVDEGPTWGGDTGKIHRGRSKADVFSNAARANNYETCASVPPIRTLLRDTLADPTLPNPTLVIDPRPGAASSLKSGAKASPGGFFENAPYRGAFSNPNNWAAKKKWSTLSRLGYFPMCDLVNFPNAVPDEVDNVRFASKTAFTWDGLAMNTLGYDVLRSTNASDFTTATVLTGECGDGDTTATDATNPASSQVFHYLVRGSNPCGNGTLGYRSSGTERTGVACP